LAMADEVKLDSKRDFNDMLKRWIGNPVISLRRRNHGTFKVPNITNWIFTTNSMRPVVIEASDRRNTFIHTTENQAARKLATRFYKLSDVEKNNAAEGLAALLSTITIDDQLINTAYDTDLKQAILALSEKPLLTWLQSGDVDEKWPVGTYMQNDTIIQLFQNWAANLKVNRFECEPAIIRQQLEELQNAGWVQFKRPTFQVSPYEKPKKMRGYQRLKDGDSDLFDAGVKMELAPYEKKSPKLKQLQSIQRKQQHA